MPVCHIISGLGTGGAQRMLVRLLAGTDRHVVISLTGDGPQGEALRERGVAVHAFRLASPSGAISLLGLLRRLRPHRLVGWMYHGNLAASAMGKHLGADVIWNIRHSLHDLRTEKITTRTAIRSGAWFSPTARAIVYNSTVAARQHEMLGYRKDRTVVIPNGFDMTEFVPARGAYAQIREELGLASDAFVIGHLARFHPMKGHMLMLKAFAQVTRDVPAARLLMAGTGVNDDNTDLRDAIQDLGLAHLVFLLGERRDIPRYLTGLDLFVSSSSGEGFPNALAEAAACGIPAVATDVGDSAFILGSTGKVVLPHDAAALSDAIVESYAMGGAARRKMGDAAREATISRFEIATVSARFHSLWLNNAPAPSRQAAHELQSDGER